MIVVGFLLGKGPHARWLIPIGLVIVAAGNYWMSSRISISRPWHAVWPRVVLGGPVLGLQFFAAERGGLQRPSSPQLRGASVGMLALLRNEGGSVGTSMAQTIQERREQFHTLRLNEHLDPFQPLLQTARQQGQQFFLQCMGDPAASRHMTMQVIANLRDQQAISLSYFDVFWSVPCFLSCSLPWYSSCVLRWRRRGPARGRGVNAGRRAASAPPPRGCWNATVCNIRSHSFLSVKGGHCGFFGWGMLVISELCAIRSTWPAMRVSSDVDSAGWSCFAWRPLVSCFDLLACYDDRSRVLFGRSFLCDRALYSSLRGDPRTAKARPRPGSIRPTLIKSIRIVPRCSLLLHNRFDAGLVAGQIHVANRGGRQVPGFAARAGESTLSQKSLIILLGCVS